MVPGQWRSNKILVGIGCLIIAWGVIFTGCKDKITGPGSFGENVFCYEKSYNSYWEIFTNNISGNNPQNISNYTGDDEYPQWSPDGRYIVFRRSVSVGGPLMYVYDLQTGTSTNLTSDGGGADFLPKWAPNGKVYFAYHKPLLSPVVTFLMNPDGSEKRKILNINPSEIFFYKDSYNFLYLIDWTKLYKSNIDTTVNEFLFDIEQVLNQKVAIQGFNPYLEELLISTILSNGIYAIGTYSITKNDTTILLTAEQGYTFNQLKYSNDYSKIALIEHSDKDEYLSVLENGVKKRLIRIPASSPSVYFSYNPMQFSTDGEYIAFSQQVFNSGQGVSWTEDLYVVNVATGKVNYIDKGFYPSWNDHP